MPNCKYIKQQEIVSYNGGVDWQDVMPAQYRKGQLIEHGSEDCAELDTIYRWRKLTGVYLCVDDVKYEKLILDESYDGGLSWYPAYPSQYTTGEAVGVDEDYCNDKFVGHYVMTVTSSGGGTIGHSCPAGYYWNGYRCVIRRTGHGPTGEDPIKIVKCDGNPELTSADTKYYSSYPSNYKFSLLSAEIGKCVTSIAASAFTNSSSMTYVSMADSVTTIGAHAFRGCTSLSGMNTTIPGELNIPSGVTSIGASAFNGCSGLTSIICSQTTPVSIGYRAFDGTNNCPIYVPCDLIGTYQNSFVPYSSMVLKNTDYLRRLEPIGGSVCSEMIARIEYSNGNEPYTYYVGTGGVLTRSMVEAPGGAPIRNASGVTFGSGCTSIGSGAFSGCSNLTSVDILGGITNIDNRAFDSCSGLMSITVEATTPPTIGTSVFANTNCPIYVPTASVETYKAASGWSTYASRIQAIPPVTKWLATYSDSSVTSAECGSSSEIVQNEISLTNLVSVEISDCVTNIGDYVFLYCSSLTSVTIPSSVTSIGLWAFAGCSGFTSITIPDSVTSIGDFAFYYCSSLTSVTIPSGVTSIGNSAFNNCTGLTTCTIGSGVTSIGNNAFDSCSGLTSVTVEATTPPTLGSMAFYNVNNFTIYVPAASVETYKAASGWSRYASRIQAIT